MAMQGAALAFVGSLLRIVGMMHWLTDVLAGIFFGVLCGAGLPVLLFWRRPSELATSLNGDELQLTQ